MYKLLSFLLLCGLCVPLKGQHRVEAEFLSGKVLKHKEGLLFDIPSFSYAIGINYRRQTDGSKAWHRYWGLPQWEGSLQYLNFGNQDVLGRAISVAPGMAFRFKRWRSNSIYFHYNTGLAYLTRPFNAIDNTSNNAIGSHFNNITKLKLALVRPLGRQLEFSFGLAFNHYSNGLTSSPNSGLNVYGLQLGLQRKYVKKNIPKEGETHEVVLEEEQLSAYRKWGYHIQAGLGLTEFPVAGGPEYPIYVYSLGATYRYADFQRLHFGLEQEYSVATYEFNRANYLSHEVAVLNARRNIFYLANELMFGSIFFKTQLGYYVPFKSTYEDQSLYFKIQTSYRPQALKFNRIQPMIGIQLKTHYFIAEYINISVGFDF